MIRFGPAGMGSVKEVEETFKRYHEWGIEACEIPFTYQVYIKKREDAIKVRRAAKKHKIKLSIHAPYWINLNSEDKEKIKQSKKRILRCCEVGTWLGAYRVVFHPGYYGKMEKAETYTNIKNQILQMQAEIKKNKYTPKLAPETTGRVNVFGSVDQIRKLVEETRCGFCIDFAHILARYKTYNFEEVFKKFKKHKTLHLHFSGIEYGDKGEKHHKMTPREEWKRLLANLPTNKNITIINESPSPVQDTLLGLQIYKK